MAPATPPVSSRDLNLPQVIGHRGAMSYAPENTLASIRKAAELGATWVEVDVALTSDGVPVIFHDPNLVRTTGYAGDLARTPYSELQKLDAGQRFHADYKGERVPSLQALIACLSELDMGMNLEIKPTPGKEVVTTRVACDMLDRLWPDHLPLPLLSSFQRPCLREAKLHAPHYPRGMLDGPLTDHWREEVAEFDCRSIHLWTKKIGQQDVATVKDSNTLLAVYTVNDGARAKDLLTWGADSIITDAPDVVFSAI